MAMTLTDHRVFRFSIGACLVVMAAIATSFAGYRFSGLAGAALTLAGIACVWFILSRMSSPALLPINSRRLTATELFTLLALCGLLYGFSFPAVSSVPRGQPPAATPSAHPIPQR